MPQFKAKPVLVEASQWFREGDHPAVVPDPVDNPMTPWTYVLETARGLVEVKPGDWIVRGFNGEHVACRPDVFAASYEPVKE